MNQPPAPYRLVRLDVPTLRALVDGDLPTASALAGTELTPFFLEEAWLWRIRAAQVVTDPGDAEWVARAAVARDGADAGRAVGHIGFHGAPDPDGRVEVAYAVDPLCRRRGHARRMLAQELARMARDPRVRVVRASIAPDNAPSLATIAGFGFERVGEQWDEEDGLEVLWELRVP